MGQGKIYLGKSNCIPVYFDTQEALNKHMLLIGSSGSGKSVEAQNIILNLARQGRTAVILDIHSVFSDGQVFKAYRQELGEYMNETDVYNNGITCNLFTPVKFADGTFERLEDTTGAVTEVLARTTKMGAKQKNILRQAAESVLNKGLYERYGIKALGCELAINNTSAAAEVKDRLYTLTAHNVFRPGGSFIKQGRINVIRLSKFDLASQEIISEMVLSYLWRMAAAGSFNRNGLFVFADEFQNLVSGKRCALNQIIAEGRKFNLNLMLATQQLPTGTQQAAQGFMQCGLVLMFKPCTGQLNAAARFIDPGNTKEWAKILKSLTQGEFVASGSLVLGNARYSKPLKTSNRM
ncbi:MAG: ATP-binding protein [Lachnospiraceae bacterium]|nr:ATP-binding protein [Lachnospiraceae bacterium]